MRLNLNPSPTAHGWQGLVRGRRRCCLKSLLLLVLLMLHLLDLLVDDHLIGLRDVAMASTDFVLVDTSITINYAYQRLLLLLL